MEAQPKVNGEKIFDDFSMIFKEIQHLLSDTSKAGGAIASEVRDQLANRLKSAQSQMTDMREMVMNRAKQADTMVRNNPWPAIGIAGGAGLLAGILLRRK